MSRIFKEKNVKILWFQLLKCAHFLVSLVFCDGKLNVFGLWIVSRDKTRHLSLDLGFWEMVIDILIDNKKSLLVTSSHRFYLFIYSL